MDDPTGQYDAPIMLSETFGNEMARVYARMMEVAEETGHDGFEEIAEKLSEEWAEWAGDSVYESV